MGNDLKKGKFAFLRPLHLDTPDQQTSALTEMLRCNLVLCSSEAEPSSDQNVFLIFIILMRKPLDSKEHVLSFLHDCL